MARQSGTHPRSPALRVLLSQGSSFEHILAFRDADLIVADLNDIDHVLRRRCGTDREGALHGFDARHPAFPSCKSRIKDARLPYAAGSAVNESKLPVEFGADTGTSPCHDP